jgi:hypothetical protein
MKVAQVPEQDVDLHCQGGFWCRTAIDGKSRSRKTRYKNTQQGRAASKLYRLTLRGSDDQPVYCHLCLNSGNPQYVGHALGDIIHVEALQ